MSRVRDGRVRVRGLGRRPFDRDTIWMGKVLALELDLEDS